VARRAAGAALAKGLFGPLQAGTVPNRSATNLLAALVHTAKAGKVSQRVGAIFTADVAQAFPSVRPHRMYYRLLNLGFEAKFAVFAKSFLTGRTVRLRLGGPSRQAPSLPQGSPLSPMLFALYIAPLAQGRDDLYNYVDDIAVFVSARTYNGAKKLLADRFAEVRE